MTQDEPSARLKKALEVMASLDPALPKQIQDNLEGLEPGLTETVFGFAFADVLARPGLDLKTREMLTVAMLATMATAPGPLEFHIKAALRVGATKQEIIEILLQVAVYAGVPAFMTAVPVAKKAFEAMEGA